MHTNTYVQLPGNGNERKCVLSTLEMREHGSVVGGGASASNDVYKIQNSSPDSNDPAGTSILYNDSGYLTNANPEPLSFSSNSNSEPSSFEASEEISLHSKQGECVTHTGNSIYFCEDAVFDEPKLEGPPLLCDNTNNYEEFSSLIKFSLEEGCGSYLTNNIQTTMQQDIYNNKTDSKCNSTLMQYDNLTFGNECERDPKNTSGTISIIKDICVSQSELIEYNHNSNTTIISSTSDESNWEGPVIRDIESSSENINSSPNFKGFPLTQHRVDLSNNFAALKNENSKTILLSKNEAKLIEIKNNGVDVIACNDNPKTPEKSYTNSMTADLSPELFSDDADDDEDVPQSDMSSFNVCNVSQTQMNLSHNESYLRNDRTLLKRVQETLSGVPPPPSVTILQVNVCEMLEKIHKNQELFVTSEKCISGDDKKTVKSLLIVSAKEDVEKKEWPEILNCRFHGLHHNRSKESEDFEHLCTKYAARYVGAETASSCTVWSMMEANSATKRRNAKLRWGVKSPGRRLSHLARRRITFSSTNLQTGGANLSVIGNTSGMRQLVIDTKKPVVKRKISPRKSPRKRNSPRKSPQKSAKRVRSPASSAKKRAVRRLDISFNDDAKPGCSKVSSTKRALFQSPERGTTQSSQFSQKMKSKRALFMSPTKKSPAKCDKKRKREGEEMHPNKFPRSLSFDVHHGNALSVTSASASGSATTLTRRNSEVISRPSTGKGELSDLHRQKMLWAVSEALRAQQIGMSHPQFRPFAHLLCKIIKALVPDLLSNGPRQPGSTSDRMLRIARQHSYAVTRGKTYDEIMQQIKEAKQNAKNSKPPSGYVPLPDYSKTQQQDQQQQQQQQQQQKNILQDKVMNIESNSCSSLSRHSILTRSPVLKTDSDNKMDENSKFRGIRRQIIFDDNEISKTYNTNR